jgi:hypothetical protein
MPKPAKWGRTETIIWPPRSPIYTYGAVFLTLALQLAFSRICVSAFALTPLQQFYLPVLPANRSCRRHAQDRQISASR